MKRKRKTKPRKKKYKEKSNKKNVKKKEEMKRRTVGEAKHKERKRPVLKAMYS